MTRSPTGLDLRSPSLERHADDAGVVRVRPPNNAQSVTVSVRRRQPLSGRRLHPRAALGRWQRPTAGLRTFGPRSAFRGSAGFRS
jgi:hypothetical protein